MTRLATLAAALAALAPAGCLDEWLDKPGHGANSLGKPVDTPKLPEASIAAAARVDQVGRELLAANPFLGVDPTFHTVALAEPAIFHPDLNGVLVSEGLVTRCKTDADLAAVLATELGQMSAEKRLVDRVRPGEPLLGPPDSGSSADQSVLAERAMYEKRNARGPSAGAVAADGRTVAIDVLRAAGHSEKDLDAVAQLLSEAARNRGRLSGLGRKADAPRWSP